MLEFTETKSATAALHMLEVSDVVRWLQSMPPDGDGDAARDGAGGEGDADDAGAQGAEAGDGAAAVDVKSEGDTQDQDHVMNYTSDSKKALAMKKRKSAGRAHKLIGSVLGLSVSVVVT
eukprot:6735460-Pyramimonas_sp.AAC.1